MKNIKVVAFLTVLFASNAFAQQSLHDQINAVEEVQEQNEAESRAAQEAQQRHLAVQKAAAEDLKRQKAAQAAADKKRDQEYEDKLRELDLQSKSLEVEGQKARVARANEYIDQELKEKAATTDVIKSQADASRNLSEGTKDFLEKSGDAAVKKQSGLFNR